MVKILNAFCKAITLDGDVRNELRSVDTQAHGCRSWVLQSSNDVIDESRLFDNAGIDYARFVLQGDVRTYGFDRLYTNLPLQDITTCSTKTHSCTHKM